MGLIVIARGLSGSSFNGPVELGQIDGVAGGHAGSRPLPGRTSKKDRVAKIKEETRFAAIRPISKKLNPNGSSSKRCSTGATRLARETATGSSPHPRRWRLRLRNARNPIGRVARNPSIFWNRRLEPGRSISRCARCFHASPSIRQRAWRSTCTLPGLRPASGDQAGFELSTATSRTCRLSGGGSSTCC